MQTGSRLWETIEQLNSEDARRVAETFRFMEEQKIKKALGPAEWEKLKAELLNCAEAMNTSAPVNLIVSGEGIYKIAVTNKKNGRVVSLRYDGDVPCVFYASPSGTGHLPFRVSADGNSVSFLRDELPREIEELALFFVQRASG